MKITKYLFDIFYKNKIIVFFLLSILSTFNAPFLFLQNFKDLNLYKIILIYQYVLPVIIFLFLIFYIYKLNYLKNFIFGKDYFILKFLFFLNFIQIFGIFFSNLNYFTPIDEITSQALTEVSLDWKSTYTRIIFIINNFNIILIGFFCQKQKKLKFNLTFLIGFFLIVSCYYCYKIFYEYFSNIDEIINFYASSVLHLGTTTLNFINPRPTGLARIILLVSIFLMMLYLFYKPKYTTEKKLLRYFAVSLIIILNFFIIQLQSRTSSYFLFLIPIFFLIFFYFYKQRKTFFIIILLIAIPFSLAHFATDYKLNLLKKRMTAEKSFTDQQIQSVIQNYNRDANRLSQASTSGRITIWKGVMNSYKKIPIIGYGVLGDKFAYSVSVSNIFLYFLISGGIVGLLAILLFNVYILKNIFYLLISKKLFTSNSAFLYISFFFICFFLFRSFFENSYGQFGIDFIFFVPSYLIFESYLKKFKII
jgi:O-antigen ligase